MFKCPRVWHCRQIADFTQSQLIDFFTFQLIETTQMDVIPSISIL